MRSCVPGMEAYWDSSTAWPSFPARHKSGLLPGSDDQGLARTAQGPHTAGLSLEQRCRSSGGTERGPSGLVSSVASIFSPVRWGQPV